MKDCQWCHKLQKELAQVTYALEKEKEEIERYGYTYQLLYNLRNKEVSCLKQRLYFTEKENGELLGKQAVKNYSHRFWTDLLAIFWGVCIFFIIVATIFCP